MLFFPIIRQCCHPSHALQIVIIFVVILFILIGAIIFQELEHEAAIAIVEQERHVFLQCIEQQISLSKNYYGDENVDIAPRIAKNCFKTLHGQWNFDDSVLFAFSLVTTIGYGNVFPHTTFGKIFCCIYSLIGIPLTMIAIANVGKYLAGLFKKIEQGVHEVCKTSHFAFFSKMINKYRYFRHETRQQETENNKIDAKTFIVVFLVYIALGSYAISWWEPELSSYSTAVYFNLLSLTSTGLGDYWPNNGPFLILTLTYITIGLAITTMAFDMASDYLRKLHYYRQKISNVRNVVIRLGSKKVSVGRFLNVICTQLGVNQELIEGLDLDDIMQTEIDKAGERNQDILGHSGPFDPDVSGCIDEEMFSLLSGQCPEPISVEPAVERYELLWPADLRVATKTDVSGQTIEMKNLASSLKIFCKMIKEDLEITLFPPSEVAESVMVDFQDLGVEFAMIPLREEEYREFYERHRKAN